MDNDNAQLSPCNLLSPHSLVSSLPDGITHQQAALGISNGIPKNQGQSFTYDTENVVPLASVADCLVDNAVLFSRFQLAGGIESSQSILQATQVYLTDALVKDNFGSIELELEPELFIVTKIQGYR